MDNIKLKVFLENHVFPVFSFVNRLFKHDEKKILFYINSSFRESSKVLFDYMVKKGYNKKYKIIVSCENYKELAEQNLENVSFESTSRGFLSFFRCKYVFYSVGRIPLLPSKEQFVMQIWHGVPLKDADKGLKLTHTPKHKYYTWLLAPSEFLKPVYSKWFSYPEDGIYVGGYPRCDLLFENSAPYDFGEYKKLIIWVPTFRKSIRGMKDSTVNDAEIIPVLTADKFSEFNNFLQQYGIKVVVKLHPEQNLANYNLVDMDHFLLLSHSEFIKKKMDLYPLMRQCDALITDYSSVYFDYMLLDRPIGFTVDDIAEYGKNRGFALDPNRFMPGEKISNFKELKKFILNIAEDKDPFANDRNDVNKLINQYPNGGYCQRVLDFSGLSVN